MFYFKLCFNDKTLNKESAEREESEPEPDVPEDAGTEPSPPGGAVWVPGVSQTDTSCTGRPLRGGGVSQVTCSDPFKPTCSGERSGSVSQDDPQTHQTGSPTSQDVHGVLGSTGAVPGVPVESDPDGPEGPEDLRPDPRHLVLRQIQLSQAGLGAEAVWSSGSDSVPVQPDNCEVAEPVQRGPGHSFQLVFCQVQLTEDPGPAEPVGVDLLQSVSTQTETCEVLERTEGSFGDPGDTGIFNLQPGHRGEAAAEQRRGVDESGVTEVQDEGPIARTEA